MRSPRRRTVGIGGAADFIFETVIAVSFHGQVALCWRTFERAADTAGKFELDPAWTNSRDWINKSDSVIGFVARKAGLEILPLPGGNRLRRRGNLLFAFNYGNDAWEFPEGGEIILGER